MYQCSETVFLEPTDEIEICRTFMSLKNTYSTDIEDVQIKPVKYVIDAIAPCLNYIFNLVLEFGCFPSRMKKAKISVIFKGGEKNNLNNYRPVSILPVFSKGLEKIIFSRVNNFFSKHDILIDSQHGFRQGKSTETALLTMKELIIKNIEGNRLTLGVFIDYSKAFDYINHEILLKKLHTYGVRGVAQSLLQSYLYDRKQCVAIDNNISSSKLVTAGVPQGSVLGPFLFNVYINDVVQQDSNAVYVIYADDMSLFISGWDTNEIILKAERELSKLWHWSNANGLKINTNKSKAILFKTTHKQTQIIHDLLLGDTSIEIVNKHRILGVTFCANMTWTDHIEALAKSLSSATGALSRCQHILPYNAKLHIYHALFNSHINYCTLVWGTTTAGNVHTILVLQKKAIRYIANVPRLHSTAQLYTHYGIISVKNIYEFRLLHSLFWSNESFRSFLKRTSDLSKQISDPRTRGCDRWLVPRRRTEYFSQSLTYNLPFILNKYLEQNINFETFTSKKMREFFVNNR